jgi:hypothetical protein
MHVIDRERGREGEKHAVIRQFVRFDNDINSVIFAKCAVLNIIDLPFCWPSRASV